MKKVISVLLAVVMLVSMLPAVAYAAGAPEITNPGFETGTDGPEGWTSVSATGGNLVEWAEDKYSEGSRSIKITDVKTNGAVGIYSATAPVDKAGVEYILFGDFYAESGTFDLMLEFRKANNTRDTAPLTKTFSTGQWDTLSVIGTSSVNSAGVRVYINSNGANAGVAWFDNLRLCLLTPGLLARHIDIMLKTNNSTYLLTALQSKTGALTGVTAGNKDAYLAALQEARTAKGAELTLAEVQTVVTTTNRKQTLLAVKTALESDGTDIALYNTGTVQLPTVSNSDVTAAWTAVTGTAAARFTVSDGTAVLNSLPANSEENETAQLTLTLSCGTESTTVAYSVTVYKEVSAEQLAALCQTIRAGNEENTLAGLKEGAFGFSGVVDANAAYYQSGLLKALTDKGSDLTKAEIQAAIEAANEAADSAAAVAKAKADLEAAGTEIFMKKSDNVPLPAVPEGITAAWTAVSAEAADYVRVEGGHAVVTDLPSENITAKITLMLRKGDAQETLEYTLTLSRQLLQQHEVPNASFEFADDEGYPTSWTISNVVSKNPETGEIITEAKVSDDCAYIGSQSAFLQDYSTKVSVGLRSAGIPVKEGYEYIAEVMYRGTGTAVFYIEYYNAGSSRITTAIKTVTATDTWQKLSVSKAAPEGAVTMNILLYCNQGTTGAVYYDDARVYEVTAEYLVDQINDAVKASDAASLMAAVNNGAMALSTVDGHDADYLSALQSLEGPLTLEAIRKAVNDKTAEINAADLATLNEILAALKTAGQEIELTETGLIDVPAAATGSGVKAVWNAVEGADAERIRLRNNTAVLLSRPLAAEGDGTAALTLHMSKGTQELTTTYAVTIKAWAGDEDKLVRLAEELEWSDICGQNESQNDVTTALTLPAEVSGAAGTADIVWSAAPAGVVDPETGAVTRSAYGIAGTPVVLTATLSIGEASYEKSFQLFVTGEDDLSGRRLEIKNPGFENGLYGWIPAYLQGTFTTDAEYVYTGEGALKVADPDLASSAAVRSTKVRGIREGYTYRLTVMAMADQTTAKPYAYIEFWNNDGVLLSSAYAAYSGKVGSWALMTKTLTAPVGATQLSVLLYSGSASDGDCFFDDVVVTELPLVQNQNLSSSAGWTSCGSGEMQYADGKLILAADGAARSSTFAVKPGQTYVAAAEFARASGAELTLEFYDSGRNLLTSRTVQATEDGAFAVDAMAPDKAATAAVLLKGAAEVSRIELFLSPAGTQITTMTGEGANQVSNEIPIFGGMQYEAVANVTNAADAAMTLRFYDMNGAKIREKTATASADGILHVLETAPYQTYYATVTTEGGTDTVFENIALYAVTKTVSNASFENVNVLLAGTFPYQWTRTGDVVAQPDSEQATLGTQSLLLRGLTDTTEGGVHSSMIQSVSAGRAYTASVSAKVISGSAKLVLTFYDADYQPLKSFETGMTACGWKTFSVEGTAPAGTVYATVSFMVSGQATLYLDDVRFAASVIDVGTQTQLFIDDYLVGSMTDVTRVLHKAEKTDPVLTYEYPWESTSAYTYGTVLFDDDDGVYKMWYQAGNYVCYATSEDGVTWTKPLDLGVYEYNGSTNNNIIGIYHIANVFKDEDEPDSDKRFKMVSFNFDYNTAYSYYCYYTSPDGIHWSEATQVIYSYDVINIAYDAENDQYVGVAKIYEYNNTNYRTKRYERMVVSDDLIHWSEPIRMNTLGDLTDAEGYLRADSYGCGLYCVGGTYVGFNWVYSITNNDSTDGYVDVELVYSRELTEDFQRVSYEPIIDRGPDGSWDDEMIYTAAQPIRVGDELWLYYGGWDGDHLCDARSASTAIAKWRLDGFVSLDGGANGVIETKPMTFDGRNLILNADAAGGKILVELLDENGNPIRGFTKDDCDPMTSDSVNYTVSWHGRADLSALAGKTVSMRIYAANSAVYTFRFSNGGSGETVTYTSEITVGKGGTAAAAPAQAAALETVTLTVKPDSGYAVDQVTVTDVAGNTVNVTDCGGGIYKYQMPVGGVKVTVTFREVSDPDIWQNPFVDVSEKDWYYEAVRYAVENGLFDGMTDDKFAPHVNMTRGMLATVLWRLEGCPQTDADSSFTDVTDRNAWYYDAILWAADKGIVDGFDNGEFRPNDCVTREQMAAMLYRCDKVCGAGGTTDGKNADMSRFTDWNQVQSWARDAFRWAYACGLVDGMTDTTLVPAGYAQRCQVAKVLMQYCIMIEGK